ncbi:hypothetical protein TELCIR_08421, partial [Teladorsagia circumcincta]
PYSSSYAAAHGSLLRPSKTMIDVLAPMRPNAADGTGANLPSTASSSAIGGPNNCGYDDENGSYQLVAHDHIAYRYEILKVIGKGSFGQVIKAYDHKYQQYVALKLVRNEKRFHRQADEEIRILPWSVLALVQYFNVPGQ